MGFNLGIQTETHLRQSIKGKASDRCSSRDMKKSKNRAERHKANQNPECLPTYRRYSGLEY